MFFQTPHYWKRPEASPICDHHSGGDDYYSDVCVCFMSDGTFELNRYIDSDDLQGWNSTSDHLTVTAWMEL